MYKFRMGLPSFGLAVQVCLVASAAVLSGCGATDGGENLGSMDQAFGSAACAAVSPNATFASKIDPATVSPTSYNNCFRSYVVDITALDAAYTGAGSGGGADARINVGWEGAAPTNQADCEKTLTGVIYYKKVGSSWIDQTGEIDAAGVWFGGALAVCNVPIVSSPITLQAGAGYRIAATVRADLNSTVTHAMNIQTLKKVIIH